MKEVLLITDVDFWRKGAGHRMRIYYLIKYLCQKVNLTVFYIGGRFDDIEAGPIFQAIQNFTTMKAESMPSMDDVGQYAKRVFRKKKFDCIIIEYIHNTFLLNYFDVKKSKIILDAHDIISERSDQFKQFNYEDGHYNLSKDTEFEIFDIYDKVLVLSQPDFEYINSELNKNKALLCPYACEVHSHSFKSNVENVAFIGSEYQPNIDGINFFIAYCWDLVHKRYPDIKLHIYGNVCNSVLKKNENLILKGYVKSLKEIYAESDIIINPVRFGAGLKIKNIEALANGKPLVTTKHGSRGLETGVNSALLVADDPTEFFNCLSYLIDDTNKRMELAKNASAYIDQYFSPENCYAPLLEEIF